MAVGGGEGSRREPGSKSPASAGTVEQHRIVEGPREVETGDQGIGGSRVLSAVGKRPGSSRPKVWWESCTASDHGPGAVSAGLLAQLRTCLDVILGAAVGRVHRLLPCGTGGPPRRQRGPQ